MRGTPHGRNLLRRILSAALAAAAIAFAAPAAMPAGTPGVNSAQAHSCSSGYRHAVIGGAHKCLRRGQYCARSADSQYRRYGFRCYKRDYRGSYHLS